MKSSFIGSMVVVYLYVPQERAWLWSASWSSPTIWWKARIKQIFLIRFTPGSPNPEYTYLIILPQPPRALHSWENNEGSSLSEVWTIHVDVKTAGRKRRQPESRKLVVNKMCFEFLFHCIDLIFFFSLLEKNFIHTIYFHVSPPQIPPRSFPVPCLTTHLIISLSKKHKTQKLKPEQTKDQ